VCNLYLKDQCCPAASSAGTTDDSYKQSLAMLSMVIIFSLAHAFQGGSNAAGKPARAWLSKEKFVN
jgi:hypothetical protein